MQHAIENMSQFLNPRAPNAQKYFWKPEYDEYLRRIYADHIGNKRNLSAALTAFAQRLGFPKPILKNRAGKLGLCLDIRKPWSKEELEFLAEHAAKGVKFLQRRLHRSYNSVRSMLDARQISYRVTEGYSREELAQVLGVSKKTVTDWIRQRLLIPDANTDRFSELDVEWFIKNHPSAYRLKRVDEAWFKGIVFPAFGVAELRYRSTGVRSEVEL